MLNELELVTEAAAELDVRNGRHRQVVEIVAVPEAGHNVQSDRPRRLAALIEALLASAPHP